MSKKTKENKKDCMLIHYKDYAELKKKLDELIKAGDGLYGIACNSGPGVGRVKKMDAWRIAKKYIN